jgi:hypothetical protein
MGKTKDVREAVEAELDFDPLVDPRKPPLIRRLLGREC